MKYFSMFTGVGGFELGFKNTRSEPNISRGRNENSRSPESLSCGRYKPSDEEHYKCVGFSEIDKYASQLLTKRFPNIPNFGECTKINPNELPDFDMLCGGFPCQAFSVAGKRRGFEDTRGTLFFEIARILEAKRPKIVFLENVKGLLNHNKGETFSVIIQTLDELGYEVQWMVLNSKFFGVPQNRERVFIIGNIRGTSRSEILPFRKTNESHSKPNEDKKEVCAITQQARQYSNWNGTFIHNIYGGFGEGVRESEISPTLRTPKGGGHLPMIAQRTPLRFLERNQKNIEGDYSFTVDSSNTGGIKQGTNIRRLTPLECERLQGFPDNWTEGFSNTQRYKMMGNAVTVNVIRAIGEKLF